jgi:pyruvate,water dikinase
MQGVPVSYADIFNSRALVELASKKGGYSSEPSYGTHFFQDLVEAQIYPLAISPEEAGDRLNLDFIQQATDQMSRFFPTLNKTSHCIKLIHIPTERPGCLFEIVMDGQRGLGYISQLTSQKDPKKRKSPPASKG